MKTKRLFCGIIFALVMMMAGYVSAQTFTTSDLEGTSYVYISETDAAGATYWVYGSITVDNAGNITGGSYTAPDGTVVAVTGGQFTIDNDGIMAGSVVTATGTGTFPSGKMDQSKTISTFVGIDAAGVTDLGIAIKGSIHTDDPDGGGGGGGGGCFIDNIANGFRIAK